MEEKILKEIKELLGPGADNTYFDGQILIHINSVVSILSQLGLTCDLNYTVTAETTWQSLLGSSSENLNLIKTYMYIKVKLVFDPPSSSFVLASLERQEKELEWRVNALVD